MRDATDRSGQATHASSVLPCVGWREWISFPALGIKALKAKVDTGARTSTLHAFAVTPFERDGRAYVAFSIHPNQRDNDTVVNCEALVADRRCVRDSGGHAELRYVVETEIGIGHQRLTAEVTLTDRDSMQFRCLLGRTTLRKNFLVDPGRSYLIGKRPR